MTTADEIRARMERDTTKLATATANEVVEREAEKLVKAIRTKTTLAIMKRIGKAVVLTIQETGEVDIRKGGSGEKSQSVGRQEGVTGWIVNGKDIGSPMVSRMLATVYNVERPKDVYDKDSPERFARKSAALERIGQAKVKVVRGDKATDAVAFLKSTTA